MKQFRRIFLFMVVIAGCSPDEQPELDSGKSYMPLQVGRYQIYDIAETIHTPLNDPEERHYQLKTEVVDSFIDGSDGVTFVVHRSKRNSETDPWSYVDSWGARITDNEAIIKEENISFVKIRFPITTGKKWNGNEYNSLEADEYELTSTKQPYVLPNEQFENTVFVDQENRVDLLFNDRRFEVYADDVGLIYREITDIEYCSRVECFGQGIIETGLIYKQTIIEYGAN